MRSKRMNRQGSLSAGGPSRPSNQNRGRQGNRPYNRPQSNRGSNRPVNQGGRGEQIREKLTCYKCGEEGHFANKCGVQDFTCHNCQKPGHFARD
ncbi:zinc finger protein 9, partial [Trifolium medium]|nr:zinc finger protein 9 [Trifolium medium]